MGRPALRTLTPRDLNRAVLARQLLLDRAAISPPTALERVSGLQAQYAPAMYIGLWSRLHGFERPDLTEALERRTVVQGTLMRATIHLVSAADYWPLAIAIRDERRQMWLRAVRHQPGADDLAASAGRLRAHLRSESPLRRRQLDQIVGKEQTNGVGMWLDLVRVPPSGTWERRRADLYGAAEDWLGPPPAHLDTDTAVDHLVRRYLGGFGPATVAEIANWAGLRNPTVAAALGRVTVRRFRAEDGDELVDLPRAPLPDAGTPAPVRLLPAWDAILLAHARRAVVLPEPHRPKVFNTKTPQSAHTFLVDGQVAGTWRFAGSRVDVEPFEPLAARVRTQVHEEADRMAAFLA
ncbi:MAG: winged helix DNA-binding domain-containing protein [Acidimicrobiales bacterium]